MQILNRINLAKQKTLIIILNSNFFKFKISKKPKAAKRNPN
jgi:hypothetical protein